MKFNFAIGNPPYQEKSPSDKKADTPIYHYFMDAAFLIADKVELVTPARFLFNAGSTPKQWNEKMLTDPHFKSLRYVTKSDLVFPGTDIKGGGVLISYRDIDKIYEPINIFVNHTELLSLINKVKKTNFNPLSELIFTQTSLKFTERMYLEHPEIDEQSLISKGQRYNLASNIFDKLENIVFFNERPHDKEEYVQIYGRKDNERKYMWIKREYIQGSKNFNKYKVMVPIHNGSGAIGEVLSTPLIGTPLIGHTETFLTIGCFETEEEASNCLKYIKTKFARVMLGVLKTTQSNTKQKWRYVPQQNFAVNSDIDWTKSINEIDTQLYRKYNLTEDEKEFIETIIRPMKH